MAHAPLEPSSCVRRRITAHRPATTTARRPVAQEPTRRPDGPESERPHARLPNLLMRNAFPPGHRRPSRIEPTNAANGQTVAAKTRPDRVPTTAKIRPGRRDLWCRASMHYRLASHRATNSLEACGRGAVGSAQPCQGWGRGFESRRPLDGADASTPAVEWPSGEATACKAVHTGSIPVSTSKMGPARLAQRESASLTRKRSLVQSQYRAPALP